MKKNGGKDYNHTLCNQKTLSWPRGRRWSKDYSHTLCNQKISLDHEGGGGFCLITTKKLSYREGSGFRPIAIKNFLLGTPMG